MGNKLDNQKIKEEVRKEIEIENELEYLEINKKSFKKRVLIFIVFLTMASLFIFLITGVELMRITYFETTTLSSIPYFLSLYALIFITLMGHFGILIMIGVESILRANKFNLKKEELLKEQEEAK